MLALIPFFIAFYYFYYRQQRNISESLIIKNDISFFIVFYTCLVIWSIIWHPDIWGAITFGELVCLTFSIIWGGYFIYFVFRRLKIKYIISETCSEINDLLQTLDCCYWGNFVEPILCEDLIWKFEILFQVLYYAVDKKINIIYEESLKQMQTTICLLNEVLLNNAEFAQDSEMSNIINSLHSIYAHILKRYVKLCILLYSNQQYSEFKKTRDTLFEFYPKKITEMSDNSSIDILDEFFYSFGVIGLYLSGESRNEFQSFVKEVEQICNPGLERLEFCAFFKALLVKTIENDDLKFLTELCYLQNLFLNQIASSCKNLRKRNFMDNDEKGINPEIEMAIENKIKDSNSTEYYRGILLYVLLQAAVKTIELGLYGQTGFLVKYIVSNYASSDIQVIIRRLVAHDVYNDNKLNDMCKKLKSNFLINPQTAWYCMKKLVLLLRAQQLFRCQSNQKEAEILEFNLIEDRAPEFDKKYCIDKIINVGEAYGMLAINRKWFR